MWHNRYIYLYIQSSIVCVKIQCKCETVNVTDKVRYTCCICLRDFVCVAGNRNAIHIKVTCTFFSSDYEIEYTTWTAAEISSGGFRASAHRKLAFDYFVRTVSISSPVAHVYNPLQVLHGWRLLYSFFFSCLNCKSNKCIVAIFRHMIVVPLKNIVIYSITL